MALKVLRSIAIIILVVMPYSTILSVFSPYESNHTFQTFLLASIIFAMMSLLLGWFVADRNLFRNKGVFFFLLGMLVAPALMIGMPETSPKLLERTTEEHFRFGLLLLATIVFAIGFILLMKNLWNSTSSFNKLIIIPFAVCVAIMIWDNTSSYNFSFELKQWIVAGKTAEDFFPNYDFKEFYRTLGRSLLFIIVPWLSYILLLKQQVKKWQLIVLSIFCLLGVIFFFLFNFVDFRFYFPFMVPAIALAPAYWLGLVLLCMKSSL